MIQQEAIYITKNGYSNFVVMIAEYYERFASENRINQAIFENEQEFTVNGEKIDAKIVFDELKKAYRDIDDIFSCIAYEKMAPENAAGQISRIKFVKVI